MNNLPVISNTEEKLSINGQPAMSSLEMSKLTGRPHNDLMKALRNELKKFENNDLNQTEDPLVWETSSYQDSQGKKQPMILLGQEAALQVLTVFSADARRKVTRKWFKLEKDMQAQQPPSPPQQKFLGYEDPMEAINEAAGIAFMTPRGVLRHAFYYRVTLPNNEDKIVMTWDINVCDYVRAMSRAYESMRKRAEDPNHKALFFAACEKGKAQQKLYRVQPYQTYEEIVGMYALESIRLPQQELHQVMCQLRVYDPPDYDSPFPSSWKPNWSTLRNYERDGFPEFFNELDKAAITPPVPSAQPEAPSEIEELEQGCERPHYFF